MIKSYRMKQIQNLFATSVRRESIVQAESSGVIPTAERVPHGKIQTRAWTTEQLPKIGERYGFLKRPGTPQVVTVFATKGGVLKTTCALNLARLAALHNIRTVVVGLDLQCDISVALGYYMWHGVETLDQVLQEIEDTVGLPHVYRGEVPLSSAVVDTDIPTLKLIPEIGELANLERVLSTRTRREYWIREKIIPGLKEDFDLIIFDCSPNWSDLITNAIVACDVLISPVECHINQFRNLKVFQDLVAEFRRDMHLDFEHVYVPTRFVSSRRLSTEIRGWYASNLSGVTNSVIRETVQGEEAVAARLSLPEYNPTSLPAAEMRELMSELFARMHRSDVPVTSMRESA